MKITMIQKAQNKLVIALFLKDAEMWESAMSEMKTAYEIEGKK